jgi:hypothetical protein
MIFQKQNKPGSKTELFVGQNEEDIDGKIVFDAMPDNVFIQLRGT